LYLTVKVLVIKKEFKAVEEERMIQKKKILLQRSK